MKASKSFSIILLAAVGFLATSAIAVDGIHDNDHAALAQYSKI